MGELNQWWAGAIAHGAKFFAGIDQLDVGVGADAPACEWAVGKSAQGIFPQVTSELGVFRTLPLFVE